MTGRTHIIGAVALASTVQVMGLEIIGFDYVSYYTLTLIGALLPDIDHPKSIISKYTLGIYKLFKPLGHRGATHSLIVPFILQLGLWILLDGKNVALGLGIGYSSHLLLDLMNPRGIPLLYPIDKKKFRAAKLHTGEMGEEIIAIALFILVLYNIWHMVV